MAGPDMTGWQSMGNAPGPGSRNRGPGPDILAFCPPVAGAGSHAPDTRWMRIIWWEPLVEGGAWVDDHYDILHPTHWMPLPAAPATVAPRHPATTIGE